MPQINKRKPKTQRKKRRKEKKIDGERNLYINLMLLFSDLQLFTMMIYHWCFCHIPRPTRNVFIHGWKSFTKIERKTRWAFLLAIKWFNEAKCKNIHTKLSFQVRSIFFALVFSCIRNLLPLFFSPFFVMKTHKTLRHRSLHDIIHAVRSHMNFKYVFDKWKSITMLLLALAILIVLKFIFCIVFFRWKFVIFLWMQVQLFEKKTNRITKRAKKKYNKTIRIRYEFKSTSSLFRCSVIECDFVSR